VTQLDTTRIMSKKEKAGNILKQLISKSPDKSKTEPPKSDLTDFMDEGFFNFSTGNLTISYA
jgi:hypothetical protein